MTRQPARPRPEDGTVDSAIRGLGGSRNLGVIVMRTLAGRPRA